MIQLLCSKMYILNVKPLKYLSVNHSLYYHRWFDMQCILKSVGKERLNCVFGMQHSWGRRQLMMPGPNKFHMSVSSRLAFMLSFPELRSCMLRECPFAWLARTGVLSPSSSRFVSRISPILLARKILACPLWGSWSRGRPVRGGAGGSDAGS